LKDSQNSFSFERIAKILFF